MSSTQINFHTKLGTGSIFVALYVPTQESILPLLHTFVFNTIPCHYLTSWLGAQEFLKEQDLKYVWHPLWNEWGRVQEEQEIEGPLSETEFSSILLQGAQTAIEIAWKPAENFSTLWTISRTMNHDQRKRFLLHPNLRPWIVRQQIL